MSIIRQASEDAYETENPLYEYDRTMLSEQIATIALALADEEVRALDILLEATAICYTDCFYEGDLDTDFGFITSEIGTRFLEQAEYHDETGLYRGRYIPDDELPFDLPGPATMLIGDAHRCSECGAVDLGGTGTIPRFRCTDGRVRCDLVRRGPDVREI